MSNQSILYRQSFTIHGLWPDQTTRENFGQFNINFFTKNVKLLDDMNNYWPPKAKKSHSATFLWQHEW